MEAKENIDGHSNSLLHDQTTNFDIETGLNAPTTVSNFTTRASIFAKGVLAKLSETIRGNRYHLESDKIDVYKRLMDNLDDVEERHHPKFTFFLIAVELIVLSGLTAALDCTLTLDSMKHSLFLQLGMWHWVTVVLLVASGLSVVRFLTFVFFWPVKRWWRIHKYVVFFTRQLKGCVDVTLWFCIVLLGWYVWFRPRINHVHGNLSVVIARQVTRFLMALCLGSFLWLLKNVLYLKLEADLHYDQFFERLQETVVYLHGIQILHNRGMWKFLTDNKSKEKLRRVAKAKRNNNKVAAAAVEENEMVHGVNIWIDVMAMEKESVPIWILRRLAEEYMYQVKLRPVPGNGDLTKEDHKILREAQKLFHQLVNKIKDPAKELILTPIS